MNLSSHIGPASALVSGATQTGSALSLSADESWLQGRSLFGGAQLALAIRALRLEVDPDLPLRSVHATFLSPVLHDTPVFAKAEVLREGRSLTHGKARLQQNGALCFECTAILGDSRESAMQYEDRRPAMAPPESTAHLRFVPGVTPNFVRHYDIHRSRGASIFSGAEDPSATIFVRPSDGQSHYDETEFLAATDVIPPPALNLMKKPAPASSMNCALELIRPEVVYGTRQWLRFDVALHAAHSGYGWQTSRIHAENGELLAVAHQAVAVFA